MFIRKWFLFSDRIIDVTVKQEATLQTLHFMNSFSNYLVGFFTFFANTETSRGAENNSTILIFLGLWLAFALWDRSCPNLRDLWPLTPPLSLNRSVFKVVPTFTLIKVKCSWCLEHNASIRVPWCTECFEQRKLRKGWLQSSFRPLWISCHSVL